MTTRTLCRTLLPITLLMIGLVTAGCEINSPQMPTFDTTLVIPLGTERIEVMDAVTDEDYLSVAGDGGLVFSLDGDPDTLSLDFDLTADIPAQSVDQGLGNFSLPAFSPLAFGFQLGDIWAPATGVTGLTTFVPPFPIDVTSTGQDLPNIESATLSDGILTVTVTNNLAVPISANSGPDQLILRLEDAATGALVVSTLFPEIAAGQTVAQMANLAGAVLPDRIAVKLRGGSPGSSGQLVTINGTDTIAMDVAFSNLMVSSATAAVETQTFNTSFDSPLPADYEINRAVIASGNTTITMNNGLPVPCVVNMVWSEVRDIDGVPLTRSFTLPAMGNSSAILDFAGYIVQADDAPLTNLAAAVEITSFGSNGQPVTLNATDGLTAALSTGTIVFSSVTGTVPAFTVALDPISEQIDLPDEMSGLELTVASLILEFTNSAGIPADMDLVLTGTSAGGVVRTLLVNEEIQPAVGRSAATTVITLDQTNSSILDFLNNLPETITLAGDVVAGGGGAIGTVHADDFAVVGWKIAAPVEVVITDATMDSDPEALDIDADMRDRIATHAHGAVLRTEILNHLPMAVQLRIVADQDTNRFDSNPMLVIGPVNVAAGLIDPVTHIVSQAVTSTPVISLTAEETRIFALPGLYTRVEAILPSTNGQAVRVMSTDFLEFQGLIEMEVLVNDDF